MTVYFKAGRRVAVEELTAALLANGVITDAQRNALAEKATGDGQLSALEVVARQGWLKAGNPNVQLSMEWLCRWFAQLVGMEYVDVAKPRVLDPAVATLLPGLFAKQHTLLPLHRIQTKIAVAVAEPFLYPSLQPNVESALRGKTEMVFANPRTLAEVIERIYNLRAQTGDGASRAVGRVLEIKNTVALDTSNVVQMVDSILHNAFERRASDIHIESHENTGAIRFRIDGRLHDFAEVPSKTLQGCISRMKVQAGLDIAEKRQPQDGRIKIRRPDGHEVELRLSTMPCVMGEKLVIRIFNPDVLVRPLSELGFDPENRELWDHMVAHPYGLLLVTGPTGSGKTTTLYSALRAMWSADMNIATVEDPVELVDRRFSQLQLNYDIGLDFPKGIRTILRQDPDIIMVGEIRDSESADVAIQAALTGHLVLATMHTNDAPSTITRLLDLNVPPYLIKAALIGVVAQRLVRRLCVECRQKADLSDSDWEFLTAPVRLSKPAATYSAAGCRSCDGIGFSGRAGIYEMLYINEHMRRLITPAADASTIRRAALHAGMSPLRVSGAKKISDGWTTLEEVIRVIPPELERV